MSNRLAKSFFKDVDDPIVISKDEKEGKREVFDWIKALTTVKEVHNNEETLKSFDPWITTKFLSMNEVLSLAQMSELVLTKHLTKLDTYRYILHTVPQRHIETKYLAKKRKKIDIVREKIVSEYYEVGSRDALLLIDSLPREELKEVLDNHPDFQQFIKKKRK